MNRQWSALIFSFILLAIVPSAFAHVVLDPKQATSGRQTFSIRVPNERDVATTKIELKIPTGVEITGILPIYGWNHIEQKSGNVIRSIVWSGGKINPGEYMLFSFSTNYTGSPGTIAWKAYQTYADGQIIAWDDSNPEHPAPKVSIKQGTTSKADDDDDNHHEQGVVQPEAKPEKVKTMDISTWISGAAFILSLAALMISIKGKKFKV